ncbi:hypothetical protein [Ignatzschineria cameli]|uniref:hypothetical protein n=1 Tax=Ignatzschineria cameli TaxID=2182793 RepID=UPI000D61C506|nr:hypothetical protein [Ignatzschineria cameli]PWD86047.1 hypothetical protein DC080_04635 [Ignatzschineria cameli]
MLKELSYIYSGINVDYLYRPATSDRRHLVVIFTGFAERYSFANVGQSFKCDVIWIKDSYLNQECYYLGKNGELDFSEAVNSLICFYLGKLKLKKEECTLLGGSKGGFASLFIGLRYDFINIVSSAPTVLIGNRLAKDKINLADFIVGKNKINSSDVISKYNNLIFNEIINSKENKNIYLFLSKDDQFYDQHQKSLEHDLRSIGNLNIIEISSNLVTQHNQVTVYSLPLIMSIIASLVEGIPPKFTYHLIGQKEQLLQDKKTEELVPIAEIFDLRINKGD